MGTSHFAGCPVLNTDYLRSIANVCTCGARGLIDSNPVAPPPHDPQDCIRTWLTPERVLRAQATVAREGVYSCSVNHLDANGFPAPCPDGPLNQAKALVSALLKWANFEPKGGGE